MSDTRTIPLADLHKRAKQRPPGYVEDVLSHAIDVTTTHYTLTLADLAKLRQKYVGTAPRPATKKPAMPRPGNVVKTVLSRLGYTGKVGCGCKSMQRKMNRWGWWGCWKRRAELVAWFTKKAAESGVTVNSKTVLGLLVAAWRESRRGILKIPPA